MYRIHASCYHDSSTKGFKHGIGHKRHDCWRGDVKIFEKIDGQWQQISRKRKRFNCKTLAIQWANGYTVEKI